MDASYCGGQNSWVGRRARKAFHLISDKCVMRARELWSVCKSVRPLICKLCKYAALNKWVSPWFQTCVPCWILQCLSENVQFDRQHYFDDSDKTGKVAWIYHVHYSNLTEGYAIDYIFGKIARFERAAREWNFKSILVVSERERERDAACPLDSSLNSAAAANAKRRRRRRISD